MKEIPIGARGAYTLRVEPGHLANTFKDSILPPVFSTPYLVLIMENAALNAIKQYLEPGESAVGTRVDVRHLVATPVGARSPAMRRSSVPRDAKYTSESGLRMVSKISAPELTSARW